MVSLVSRLRTRQISYDCLSIVKRMSTSVLRAPEDKEKKVRLNYLDGKDNGIAVLGLNRPEAKNAINKNMISELMNAITLINKDEKIRVLIIRSLVPKTFCAGADLRERSTMTKDEVQQYIISLRNFMRDVESIQAPVISAIDGTALGGGLELALATDIRTAVSDAKMGLVETKWAIIPGAGGTQRLPRVVGSAKAKELIYSAKVIDGDEAEKIGLVNQVVPQNKQGDAAYQIALDIAREILPNGPIGVRMAKLSISKGIEVPIEDGFQVESKCYEKLLHTKDRIEGLAAFVGKRTPIYRGI